MLLAVITSADALSIGVVTCVMVPCRISYLVAVVVVYDECVNISLIVGKIYWLWSSVV